MGASYDVLARIVMDSSIHTVIISTPNRERLEKFEKKSNGIYVTSAFKSKGKYQVMKSHRMAHKAANELFKYLKSCGFTIIDTRSNEPVLKANKVEKQYRGSEIKFLAVVDNLDTMNKSQMHELACKLQTEEGYHPAGYSCFDIAVSVDGRLIWKCFSSCD